MIRQFSLVFIAISALSAADGGATITPAPGFEPGAPAVSGPHTARPFTTFPRPLPAYEVDILTVKSGDVASLTAWTVAASQGYHVTAATPTEGGVVLYLERSAGMAGPGNLQLPALLEQDKAAAEAVHAKIKALNEERQKAARAAMPAPAQPPMAPVVPANK